MKKILSLIMVLTAAVAVHAQGTFGTFNGNTSNSDDPNGDGIGGTIYDSSIANASTTTGYDFAQGSGYHAQYYIGNQTTDANTLTANGSAGILGTGGSAGYYQPGTVSTSFAIGANVTVQLRAWKGSATSYENAVSGGALTGVSNLINLTLHDPQVPGPNITTMSNIILASPEPATIALGLMGFGALFIRRRK